MCTCRHASVTHVRVPLLHDVVLVVGAVSVTSCTPAAVPRLHGSMTDDSRPRQIGRPRTKAVAVARRIIHSSRRSQHHGSPPLGPIACHAIYSSAGPASRYGHDANYDGLACKYPPPSAAASSGLDLCCIFSLTVPAHHAHCLHTCLLACLYCILWASSCSSRRWLLLYMHKHPGRGRSMVPRHA